MSKQPEKSSLTYAGAGVDIQAQAQLVDKIKAVASSTQNASVLSGVGGFSSLYEIPMERYKRPVLVSGSDGVGTKLILAHDLCKHDTIGIDLVAMCVNDVLCQGADPLYFLDYYACGRLDVDQAHAIISGIAAGCVQADCALIGGETAELPGLYQGEDYDLAGFCVGAVDKPNIIHPGKISIGDTLIAIASSGPHSNGYSLIRQVVDTVGADLGQSCGSSTLGECLLEPTRIYVKALQALKQEVDIHGLAHITGGGLVENVPRMLPTKTKAVIDRDSWVWPDVFQWLQTNGNITDSEMVKTFNVGIGMVVAVNESQAQQALDVLNAQGEQAWALGYIASSEKDAAEVQWQS